MSREKFFRKAFLGTVGLMVITLLAFFGVTIEQAKAAVPYKLPTTVYWATGDVGSYPYATNATTAEKIAPALGCKIRLIPGNDVDKLSMLRSGRAHFGSLAADLYWSSMGLGQYSPLLFMR